MCCETGALCWAAGIRGSRCWVGFWGGRAMLAREMSSLLFPALEAAEVGVCDSLGTLFS